MFNDNFSLIVILIVTFVMGYTVGRSDKFFGIEKKNEKIKH